MSAQGAVAIRPHRPDEADAVVEIIRDQQQALHALFPRMRPPAEIGRWYLDALLEQCAEHTGQVLVAESQGTLVGYAVVLCRMTSREEMDEVDYTYAYVAELSVLTGWRRQGIGRALLQACEDLARADGARWFRIASTAVNADARATYTAFGFREHLIHYEKLLGDRS